MIQRLFGAGLALQAEARRAEMSSRDAILEQVDAIDAAIAEIRTVIFALSAPGRSGTSLRHRVLDAVAELGNGMAIPPRVTFTGAVDLLVPPLMVDDVVAVVRESLANVIRHAHAHAIAIGIEVDEERVAVGVVDDGVGYEPHGRASGTANIAARAELLGGSYGISRSSKGGTVVDWSVPLRLDSP